MGGITLNYFIRRIFVFFLTTIIASTVIFIIPRLAPGDPIQSMLARISEQAGYVENSDKIVEGWRERFGLNDPYHIQYLRYIKNLFVFDFGVSLAAFPVTVGTIIKRAMPWSIGLMSVCLVIYFMLGNLFGALLSWKKTPFFMKGLITCSMVFTSLPAILAALILVYIFAFNFDIFPLTGSFERGLEEAWTLEFISSVLYHSVLPALSVVIVQFGYFAIGMRGMMVTTEGEDYMIFGQAKGLKPFYILIRYQVRNAILPQMTALALSLGTIVSGQVLVESVFSYRGLGTVILGAILNLDYTVIQGTSFILIMVTAIAVLIIDLLYPLIDPRISLSK
ncbi:MAG: ABC transporter permease [Bacteroidetes bacterium]|jgi:peptide/nickel transport system permease protein|nr:ABC transporter permease [Bacteroidota bacterium]|tara:strand:- start:1240 stop:2247 length:1008 start_codon:yes stop_codon:yes gene_type:complete